LAPFMQIAEYEFPRILALGIPLNRGNPPSWHPYAFVRFL
jgi:hypothetical protein